METQDPFDILKSAPRANVIICGQTMSGKTTLLHKIINKAIDSGMLDP